MNCVRTLRAVSGQTRQQLAEAADTSQPTVAACEGGRKSPTLRTLERLAEAAGLVVHLEYVPPLTREDRRSLALQAAKFAQAARAAHTHKFRAMRTAS